MPELDPCPIFMQDSGNKLFPMPLQLIKNNDITDPAINLALEEYCLRNLDPGSEPEDFISSKTVRCIGTAQKNKILLKRSI